MSYNQCKVPLLHQKHNLSRLYEKHIHDQGHGGVSATASKVRSRFWIIGLNRKVKSIRHHCVVCKKTAQEDSHTSNGATPI